MRRRWIAALVFATALVFALAGTAVGYWVLPEGKGESGDCIIARAILERGLLSDPGLDINAWIDIYDDNCR